MKKLDFKVVRALWFSRDGDTREMTVEIGGIEQVDHQTYGCRVSVEYVGPRNHLIYGVDPMQALQLAVGLVTRVITDFNANGAGEIWWHERGDGAGF